MNGGQETVGRKFSLISHKDLMLLAGGQTVLSGGEEWNQSRGRVWQGRGEALGVSRGTRAAIGSHPTVSIWWGGLENPQPLPKCEKIFSLSFFPPFFPFLMCPCVRREEGIVMGIWCQTSKPFYSLREPPGQNVELSSQLRSCPSLSQWLGLSACFYSSHFLFHTKWDWNSKMLSALFELVNKSQCLKNTAVRLCFESYGVYMGVYMSCYV